MIYTYAGAFRRRVLPDMPYVRKYFYHSIASIFTAIDRRSLVFRSPVTFYNTYASLVIMIRRRFALAFHAIRASSYAAYMSLL